MSAKFPKIGIIGLGMVGGNRQRWFQEMKGYERGKNLFLLDPVKGFNDDVEEADIVFIAVSPPSNEPRKSTTPILVDVIKRISGPKWIVINSTVEIGVTYKLQNIFSEHCFFFNPEFLWVPNAWHDTIFPQRQIVAPALTDVQNITRAKKVLSLLPKGQFNSPCKGNAMSANMAEALKLFTNFYITQQVDFSAMIFEALGNNMDAYARFLEVLLLDKRISPSHLSNPMAGGYVGYGGHCLIKDNYQLNTSLLNLGFYAAAQKVEFSMGYNRHLLEAQGIGEAEAACKKTVSHEQSSQKGSEKKETA